MAEAKQALADGGQELDMVVNISKVLSGDWDYVRADIAAVIDVTHTPGQKVKVIFENCYLNDEQKIKLCEICGELGADWVKTSTGYGTGGATIEDLKLMRQHAPTHVQVKAAGGVRDLDTLLEVRALGVTRVGATPHRGDARRVQTPARDEMREASCWACGPGRQVQACEEARSIARPGGFRTGRCLCVRRSSRCW